VIAAGVSLTAAAVAILLGASANLPGPAKRLRETNSPPPKAIRKRFQQCLANPKLTIGDAAGEFSKRCSPSAQLSCGGLPQIYQWNRNYRPLGSL
jgi:hypothetical protein